MSWDWWRQMSAWSIVYEERQEMAARPPLRLTDVIWGNAFGTWQSSQQYYRFWIPSSSITPHVLLMNTWSFSPVPLSASLCISRVSRRPNILRVWRLSVFFSLRGKVAAVAFSFNFTPASLLVFVCASHCVHLGVFEICLSALSLFSQARQSFQAVTPWLLATLPLIPSGYLLA